MVITAGKGGTVVSLEQGTGKLLWKRNVGPTTATKTTACMRCATNTTSSRMPETVEPGLLGGVIAPMATNGSTVFVPVVNLPVHYTSQTEDTEGPKSTGELVALDAATGAVRWVQKLSTPAFSAATAVNDLVFLPIASGALYAFNDSTGNVVWQTQLPAGPIRGWRSGRHGDRPRRLGLAAGQTPELVAYRLGAGGGGEAPG